MTLGDVISKAKDYATSPMNLGPVLQRMAPQTTYDEATGQMGQAPPPDLQNPSVGGLANMISQNMIPWGGGGAAAIALSDTSKAGGLGTVGGALAKGFQAAKDAGRTWMGLEDVPKFEISDELARYKPGAAMAEARSPTDVSTTLSKVLEHPELYNNYPELKDMNFKITQDLPQGANGAYDSASNTMLLSPAVAFDANKAKETILHELQHGLQEREGFAKGGTVAEMSQLTKDRLAQNQNNINNLFEDMNQGKFEKNMDAYYAQMKALQDEQKKIQQLSSSDPQGYAGLGAYHNLAGEVEARNVGSRMNMSLADRISNPFTNTYDVPLTEQIINAKR